MRSHDLSVGWTSPGRSAGLPPATIFSGLTHGHERRWGGSGKFRRAAACATPISRKRPFSRPGHPFPGGRITQLGETEVPNAAGQR